MASSNPYNTGGGYYSGSFEANIEGPHPRRKFKLIVAILILLILIVAIILYIATAPQPQTPVTTTTSRATATVTTTTLRQVGEGAVEIRRILFASRIYDDYKFDARDNSQYKRGESVIIYFEVAGLSNRQNMYGTFDINLAERVELRDPNGNRIPELSYLIDDNILETSPTQNYIKPFEYFFNLLQSDSLGKYTQTIIITDKNTGKTAQKEIVFEVVE
jgi:hypothetical protein